MTIRKKFIAIATTVTLVSSVAFAETHEVKPHGIWTGLSLVFAGKHLMIECVDRNRRWEDYRCSGDVSSVLKWEDWPFYISYKVHVDTGVVVIQETSIDLKGAIQNGTPKLLKNCAVLDTANWECRAEADGPFDGMKKGRAYHYLTTQGVEDYAGSSVSGFYLFLFEAGLIDLNHAARDDLLTGLFHHNSAPSKPP